MVIANNSVDQLDDVIVMEAIETFKFSCTQDTSHHVRQSVDLSDILPISFLVNEEVSTAKGSAKRG